MGIDNATSDPDEQKKLTFNGLSASEWIGYSKNVWKLRYPQRTDEQIEHGATFPVVLTTRIIKMYSHIGDTVFDPFVGTGTTLKSCQITKRKGIGIELNPKFYTFAKRICNQPLLFTNAHLNLYHDDCRNMLKYITENQIQLMVTSPPYANFIQKSEEDREKVHKNTLIKSHAKHYSDTKEDFGNLNYSDFLAELKELMKKLYIVTKNGGYNVWIVKDARDTKNGIPYVPFHSDIAKIGEETGFKYHDLIVWDQNDQRKLLLNGYPTVFYTNQNSSFIIVLRKVA